MKDKEPLRIGMLRALTWAAIFVSMAVFWGGLIAAAVAWMRLP